MPDAMIALEPAYRAIAPWRRVLPPLIILAFAAGSDATAQHPGSVTDQPAPDSIAELARRLYGQDKARIHLASGVPGLVIVGPRLKGDTLEFTQYVPGSWTLDTTAGRHRILLREVDRVEIRSSAWDKGAIIGFLVGAGAIEAVNAAGKYQIDRGETVFMGLVFGTAGAVIGGPIGAFFHKWHTVYGAT